MRSKVSSDWLPSYVKAMRPVLEIFNMDGCFPDSPSIVLRSYFSALNVKMYQGMEIGKSISTWHISPSFLNKHILYLVSFTSAARDACSYFQQRPPQFFRLT